MDDRGPRLCGLGPGNGLSDSQCGGSTSESWRSTGIPRSCHGIRTTEQKNLSLLIRAFKDTDIALDIIGDGPLREPLLKEAEELGVELKIFDPVPNDQLPSIYNKYPMYVLCSTYEGNPKTLLEAMACERAVIGVDSPGISSIIQNNNNGLLVAPDSDKLREAIKTLMNDENLRNSLGFDARKTILNNYSLENGVRKENEMIKNIISKIGSHKSIVS